MLSLRKVRSMFSRADRPRTALQPRRTRLGVELLEDRITPAVRFVVPFDVPINGTTTFHSLRTAIAAPGIASGDVIEVKQGALPGGLNNSILPNLTNITIRGETGAGANELAEVTFTDAITVTAARQGFKLQNLNVILTNGITLQANATLAGNRITANTAVDGINIATGVLNAVIRDNQIYGTGGGDLIEVTVSTGSQNLIAGNFITSSQSAFLIDYSGTAVTTDLMRDNILIGPVGNVSQAMVIVSQGVDGLTIQNNTFRDVDFSNGAIAATAGVKNLKILRNTIDFPGQVNTGAVEVSGGASGLDTSATIIGNSVRLGSGNAFLLTAASTGTYRVRFEANNILAATIGVVLSTNGIPLTNVDLGGGTEGSVGGNNFRFQRTAATSSAGAIVVAPTAGAIQAQNNVLHSVGAEAAVFDNGDDAARPDLVTTGAPTANAAFVQGLFVRFLRRAGDINNPSGAGNLVNLLNNGSISAVGAVNAISRSAEAFGLVVDDLYHSILNRDPDPAGKQAWVNLLISGTTLEAVKGAFFASPEYRSRFAGDRAFVVSLYSTALGRTGAESEYQAWINLIGSFGRSGVAAAILNSAEARSNVVGRLFVTLLKRPASPSDKTAFVNTGLGELALQTSIAASAEGQGSI